jgi:hypothetical protein
MDMDSFLAFTFAGYRAADGATRRAQTQLLCELLDTPLLLRNGGIRKFREITFHSQRSLANANDTSVPTSPTSLKWGTAFLLSDPVGLLLDQSLLLVQLAVYTLPNKSSAAALPEMLPTLPPAPA